MTASHPSGHALSSALRDTYPDAALEVLVIADQAKKHRLFVIVNALAAVLTYPRQLLARTQTPWASFFSTRLFHRWIRRNVARWIDPEETLFTIQIQSMVDCSVPGVPHFIFTDHTHLANLQSTYFKRSALRPRWWIALESEMYRNARVVFCGTTHVEQSLIEDYGLDPAHVRVVGYGSNVPVGGHRPAPAQFEAKRLLFAGYEWERKGGPTVLAAFAQVRAAHPDATLTIVGASPTVEQDGVSVLGPVPLAAMHEHFASVSLFVFPSRLEPFGTVVTEAMQFGLPVVASDYGPFRDSVVPGETGELVPVDDPDALAAAIIALLDDPQRCYAYGLAGQARARALFSWHGVAARIRETTEATVPVQSGSGVKAGAA